jgi:hypothetical protein
MLARLPAADAYVLDGDHNYYTVLGELAAIAEQRPDDQPFPLVILHDVAWPCGRRDFYYDPGQLPPEAVHPHSYELGVKLGHRAAQPGGFRGEGRFAVALQEGGPRNGVLTAVEDFCRDRPGLFYTEIPCIFGLGILVDARLAPKLAPVLSAFTDNPLLAKLERNRLELYLHVLHLQDELNRVRSLAKASLRPSRTDLTETRSPVHPLRPAGLRPAGAQARLSPTVLPVRRQDRGGCDGNRRRLG